MLFDGVPLVAPLLDLARRMLLCPRGINDRDPPRRFLCAKKIHRDFPEQPGPDALAGVPAGQGNGQDGPRLPGSLSPQRPPLRAAAGKHVRQRARGRADGSGDDERNGHGAVADRRPPIPVTQGGGLLRPPCAINRHWPYKSHRRRHAVNSPFENAQLPCKSNHDWGRAYLSVRTCSRKRPTSPRRYSACFESSVEESRICVAA